MVQPQGFSLRPTPPDKTLSERRRRGEAGGAVRKWMKNKTGRRRAFLSTPLPLITHSTLTV